jgi:ABC-type transport system involved in multi-copper enzyme maturation permease subunit
MKAIDIALKDMTRSLRSAIALVFMFGIPLLMTGMFYLLFGNIAQGGEFSLPRTQVVVANLDEGRPKLRMSRNNAPNGIQASTLGELVVKVLQSEDLADLVETVQVPDAASARLAVDNRQAQVAVIIPSDFSHQFNEPYGQALIEFYQDPTLTIGPGIVRSFLNQFMDGLSGVKIAANIAQDQAGTLSGAQIGLIVQRYLESYAQQDNDLSASMLTVVSPGQPVQERANPMLSILGPFMGGMMIFYAFYTGAASAESILREEEERTLPRLFTTPTPQATILTGKFLAVFLTVIVQVVVLLIAGSLIFRIRWGALSDLAVLVLGVVLSASSFGIFINSLLKDTKQGGMIFGGVLTLSGMVGMISVFAVSSPSAAVLGNTVSLIVPQGWAARALLQVMRGAPFSALLATSAVMLAWSAVMFTVGVWRFNHRYV